MSVEGRIFKFESMGAVDGPGLRFIVFMQGCKMRCAYCHNPESWNLDEGEVMTSDEVLAKASRYKTYWNDKGGITVSGGEPLVQIDFLLDFFEKAKAKGFNTCVDTSGGPFTFEEPFFSKFKKLMEVTDLFMLDIKQIDDEKHRNLVGQSNKNIIEMAKYLSDSGKKMWIRHVLVPGYTDSEEDLVKLGEFISTLKTVRRFEILPYHALAIPKYDQLGIKYRLRDVVMPSGEEQDRAVRLTGADKYQGFRED